MELPMKVNGKMENWMDQGKQFIEIIKKLEFSKIINLLKINNLCLMVFKQEFMDNLGKIF